MWRVYYRCVLINDIPDDKVDEITTLFTCEGFTTVVYSQFLFQMIKLTKVLSNDIPGDKVDEMTK